MDCKVRVKAQEKFGKGADCKEKVKQKKSAGKEENCKICVKRQRSFGKEDFYENKVKRQQNSGKAELCEDGVKRQQEATASARAARAKASKPASVGEQTRERRRANPRAKASKPASVGEQWRRTASGGKLHPKGSGEKRQKGKRQPQTEIGGRKMVEKESRQMASHAVKRRKPHQSAVKAISTYG